MDAFPDPQRLIPFWLLWAAVVSLWLPAGRRAWPWLAGASLGAALLTGVLLPVGLLFILPLAGACYYLGEGRQRDALTFALTLTAVIVLSLALALHAAPGFHNLLVVQDLVLARDSQPYTLYLNYDKGIAGLLLLALAVGAGREPGTWRRVGRIVPLLGAPLLTVVMLLALALGLVRWDPKLPELLPWWVAANLLITCIAEEAFFRGLIQRRLARWLAPRQRHGALLALVVAALLFGLAHGGGGPEYVVLASVAGVGYGLAYQLTGRIEASILVHFLVNLGHFTLFSYPRLVPYGLCASPPC